MDSAFWTAAFGLAWPLVVIWVFLRLRPLLENLLKRESLSIKVAGFEFTSQEAVDKIGKDIGDLQARLSLIEAGEKKKEKLNSVSEEMARDRSLLWVDDFPSNNAFLIENFRKNGIEVVLSLSTMDAVEKLKVSKYSSIISDLGRKENGIDNPVAGFEFLEKIRILDIQSPVLIFSGHRGLQKRDQLLQAGAEDVTDSAVDVVGFVEKHLGVSAGAD